jgi:hypothetical protein
MSIASKKLVPIVEHTYAQWKEVHAGHGHLKECFLLGYKVSSCKGYKQNSAWLVMQIVEVIGF